MSIITKNFYAQRDADGAADYLIREAADRWTKQEGMVDDITVIVAFLSVGSPSQQSLTEDDTQSTGAVPAVISQ